MGSLCEVLNLSLQAAGTSTTCLTAVLVTRELGALKPCTPLTVLPTET